MTTPRPCSRPAVAASVRGAVAAPALGAGATHEAGVIRPRRVSGLDALLLLGLTRPFAA